MKRELPGDALLKSAMFVGLTVLLFREFGLIAPIIYIALFLLGWFLNYISMKKEKELMREYQELLKTYAGSKGPCGQ